MFGKIVISLLLIFSIMMTGCASTSSSVRYNKSTEKKEEVSKNPRFTSEEDSKIDSVSLSTPVQNKEIDEFDEFPEEINSVDVKEFIDDYRTSISSEVPLSFREKLLLEVIKYIDAPYKYGGNSDRGIDCSAFTKQVLSAFSVDLPRTVREQFTIGMSVAENELKFGDLVFFNTSRRAYPGHVGIYLGNREFIHSSRTLGVTVSSLDETYYKKRYVGARRLPLAQ
ncbi:C40 family peptidase [Melioribacter sp. OK-6-Me]|uniref:C40 family peptidase n=1 Tax=unclassified Melioribacter TaxID=2627329 RepID=UPI003ED9AC0B